VKPYLRLIAAAAMAALAGCAALQAPHSVHLSAESAPLRECAQWYRDLDARVEAAGVRDAGNAKVPGFPWARSNRLLAALRPAARASEPALQALADRMLALDQEARRLEMRNLSEPPAAAGQLRSCGRLLRDADVASAAARERLLERAEVADDYSGVHRLFGLYALTRFAFAGGIRRYEAETRAAFGREPALREGAVLVRHAPQPQPPLARAQVAAMLRRGAQNALGIPEPDESDLQDLLVAYAPSIEVEVADDDDRFGALFWRHRQATPAVEASRAVVYGHAAWTLYRGRPLLQLVYTLWFPARPPAAPGDILAGALDGITWRVTLAPDGEPLLYDSIHPCGCYHQFFPTPRAVALPAPDGPAEWMFSPQSLPRIAEGERPLLRVASASHYIERVSLVRGIDSLARYEILPYAGLRSLARPEGGHASAFGPDGLIAGTERPERFLFWPTGVASAGAMRQWGRHATAFVGRRHFDDAELIERRFILALNP
jgi:hypothetical protein